MESPNDPTVVTSELIYLQYVHRVVVHVCVLFRGLEKGCCMSPPRGAHVCSFYGPENDCCMWPTSGVHATLSRAACWYAAAIPSGDLPSKPAEYLMARRSVLRLRADGASYLVAIGLSSLLDSGCARLALDSPMDSDRWQCLCLSFLAARLLAVLVKPAVARGAMIRSKGRTVTYIVGLECPRISRRSRGDRVYRISASSNGWRRLGSRLNIRSCAARFLRLYCPL